KDRMIIQGRNVYPQDIEQVVAQADPAFQPGGGAAILVETTAQAQLCLLQEVKRAAVRTLDGPTLVTTIRQTVAEAFDLSVAAVALIKPGQLPRTSSGKIARYQGQAWFTEEDHPSLYFWRMPAANVVPSDNLTDVGDQPKRSQADIEAWLMEHISSRLPHPETALSPQTPFVRYGLGSVDAVQLSTQLSAWLDRSLPATLVYEYPTIASLATYLAYPAEIGQNLSVTPNMSPADLSGAIAVIGLGCRFPNAANPSEFWNLLVSGVDAISKPPPDRGLNQADLGGYLENVTEFDADFFGIPPEEAQQIDPQHRLLLEVAYEALADSGQVIADLAHTKTGVFVGISTNDYGQYHTGHSSNRYRITGNALSMAANRLSFLLNVQGPSLAIDTACSSSLAAVHLACQSLRRGEATLALAGGVNLILTSAITQDLRANGFLAADGRCKAFDVRADGYVRGEGAGIVVLKPLSQAMQDNDPIYALIRGSAINQDGLSVGLTAPNPNAQQQVFQEACQDAGVAPHNIQYMEAHGTGTRLGDPIELQALGKVLTTSQKDTNESQLCAVGSVKTNIGHLEAAAGIAGLIKTVLALKHRYLPASLHFHTPNPEIPFDKLPITVPKTALEWPDSSANLIAGVRAFGFGGTNVQLILQSAPPKSVPNPSQQVSFVLPISASTTTGLNQLSRAYLDLLASSTWSAEALTDLTYTGSQRRDHYEKRVAVVGDSATTLMAELTYLLDHPTQNLSGSRRRGLVFVFSGQGAEWLRMGYDLVGTETIFKSVIDTCDDFVQQWQGWSLLSCLDSRDETWLSDTAKVQPTLFAVQVALATLWQSYGLEPTMVIGHSVGEIAAAHMAGILSLEDALRVVVQRGQVMQRTKGQGQMVAVFLPKAEVESLITPYEGVVIAAINSPADIVVSGKTEMMAALQQHLDQIQVDYHIISSDYGFHSPLMTDLRSDLAEALQSLSPQAPQVSFFSTVIDSDPTCDIDYWLKNMCAPVNFSRAIRRVLTSAVTDFLEIGPHPVLTPTIQRNIDNPGAGVHTLASLSRDCPARTTMGKTIAQLYSLGHDIKWQQWMREGQVRPLPLYPWQRSRHWVNESLAPSVEEAEQTSSRLSILATFNAESLYDSFGFWQQELKLNQDIRISSYQPIDDLLAGQTEPFDQPSLIIILVSLDTLTADKPIDLDEVATTLLRQLEAVYNLGQQAYAIYLCPPLKQPLVWHRQFLQTIFGHKNQVPKLAQVPFFDVESVLNLDSDAVIDRTQANAHAYSSAFFALLAAHIVENLVGEGQVSEREAL
ncbi:MAG: beta-ketoacyl synthase N-terminal-like domain-containing protein, partial [Chloroflexota bacterium]